MTQEDKNLLLKDLSVRLLYGVEVEYNNTNCEVLSIDKYNEELTIRVCPGYSPVVKLENIKPYLFPLSNMTEEQKKEYHEIISCGMMLNNDGYPDIDLFGELQDFYCINHLDYRGLIPKGLAIDATGSNIY